MATEILRPDAAGDYTALSRYPGDPVLNWEDVDEAVADEDTSFVYTSSTTIVKDAYNLGATAIPDGSTINSVTVYFRFRIGTDTPNNPGYAQPFLRLSGSETTGTAIEKDGAGAPDFTTYSEALARPGGGSWAVADLDSLQAVIGLYLPVGGQARCTQVYVEVDYTIPVVDYPINSSILIGVLPTAIRTSAISRTSSVIAGALVSATRIWDGATYTSSIIVGVVASATKGWGRAFTSSVIIGVVANATKLYGCVRGASVIVGVVASATRLAVFTRASSVISGVVASATRAVTFARTASPIIGIAISATRAITTTRSSPTTVGIVVSATRIYGRTRTASVIIGIKVAVSRWKRILRQLQSFTGRNLSDNNDDLREIT